MDHFTLFKTSTALIIIHNAFISVMMHMILLYNIMYYIILSLIKKLEKQWSHATSKWIQENYVEKVIRLNRFC